jgi:hypothetical protein
MTTNPDHTADDGENDKDAPDALARLLAEQPVERQPTNQARRDDIAVN